MKTTIFIAVPFIIFKFTRLEKLIISGNMCFIKTLVQKYASCGILYLSVKSSNGNLIKLSNDVWALPISYYVGK